MIYGLLALLVLIFIVGGIILFQNTTVQNVGSTKYPSRTSDPISGSLGLPCPLCGTHLAKGQRVHSVQYESKLPEKDMEIWGCPHCYTTSKALRRCPVCHDPVPQGEAIMARVFQRPGKRTHVHVLGCSSCRKVRR